VVGEEPKSYQNKVNCNWPAIFISLLLFVGASLWLKTLLEGSYPPSESGAWGKAVGATSFLAIASVYYIFTILKRTYYDAPLNVTLANEAIILRFKHKSPMSLEWKNVERVIASVKERTIIPANPKLSGQVWYANPRRLPRIFMVSYEIANAMISQQKGDPISMATIRDDTPRTLNVEAEEGPTDNLAYGLLLGLVSSMLLIGFILAYYFGDLQFEYIFGGSSIVSAVVAYSVYRRGFHAKKETVIEGDVARVNISTWERIAGRKPILKNEDIDAVRVLRDAKLIKEPHQMEEPIYFAMLVTKDGKMYSLGPRSRATVEKIASFMNSILGKPIII
jgi:hypothetical protein